MPKNKTNPNPKKPLLQKLKKLSVAQWISFAMVAIGLGLIVYYVVANYLPKLYREIEYSRSLDVLTVDELDLVPITEIEDIYASYQYPDNRVFKTTQRKEYQDGQITLYVPRLNYTGGVLDGTSNSTLKKGVGLYNYSPLPSFGNPNVSIAGHRGVYGAEFYKLDQMQDGDLIYLYYDGFEFIYKFTNMQIVNLDNWQQIFCTDTSTVTLTTCVMDNNVERIIVTGDLVSVRECAKDEKYYLLPEKRTYQKLI